MWLRGLLIIIAILAKPRFISSETDNANEESKDIETNQDYSAHADEVPLEIDNDNPHILINKRLPGMYETGTSYVVPKDSAPRSVPTEKAAAEPCVPLKSVLELLDLISKGKIPEPYKDKFNLFKLQDRTEDLALRDLKEDSNINSQQKQPEALFKSNYFTNTKNNPKETLVHSLASISQHEMLFTEANNKQDKSNVPNTQGQTEISSSVAKSSNNAREETSPEDVKSSTDQLIEQLVKLQNTFSVSMDEAKPSTSNLSAMSKLSFFDHQKAGTDLSTSIDAETQKKLRTQDDKLLPKACRKDQTNVQMSHTKSKGFDVQNQSRVLPKLKSSYDELALPDEESKQVDLVSTQFPGSSKQFDTSLSKSSLLLSSQSEPFLLPLLVPVDSTEFLLNKGKSIKFQLLLTHFGEPSAEILDDVESEPTILFKIPFALASPSIGSGAESDLPKPFYLSSESSQASYLTEPPGEDITESESPEKPSNQTDVIENEWLKDVLDESNSSQSDILNKPSDILPSQAHPLFTVAPFPKDQSNRPWSEKISSESEKSRQAETSLKQFEVPKAKQSEALLPNLTAPFWSVFPVLNQTEEPFESDLVLPKQPDEEPLSNFTDYTRSQADTPSDQFLDLAEQPEIQPNQYSSIEIEDISPDQSESPNLPNQIGTLKALEQNQADVSLEQSSNLLKQQPEVLLNQYGSMEIHDLSPDPHELPNQSESILPNQIESLIGVERSQTDVSLDQSDSLVPHQIGSVKAVERSQTDVSLDQSSDSLKHQPEVLPNQYGSMEIQNLSPDPPELPNQSESLLLNQIEPLKGVERSQTDASLDQSDSLVPHQIGSVKAVERSQTDVSLDRSSDSLKHQPEVLPNQYGYFHWEIQNRSPDPPELLNQSESLLLNQIESLKGVERSKTDVLLEQSSDLLKQQAEVLPNSNLLKPTELQLSDQSVSQPKELSNVVSKAELLEHANLLQQQENNLPCDTKLKFLQSEIDYYRAILDEFRTNGFKSINSSLRLKDLTKPKPKECELRDVSNLVVRSSGQKNENDKQLRSHNEQHPIELSADGSFLPGESSKSQNLGGNPDGALPNRRILKHKSLKTKLPKTKLPKPKLHKTKSHPNDRLGIFVKDILLRAEKDDSELKEEQIPGKHSPNRRFGVKYPAKKLRRLQPQNRINIASATTPFL